MPEAARVNPVLLGSLLVFQNAGAVLLMRWVRAMPGESEFNTQTAVVMQEVLKGLACVAILLGTEGTLASAWAKPLEALKTGVPALLYLLQNNMQYVAVGYLDAATYTVSYQTKTIWSGILSMVLLNRTLGLNKWLGICGLCAGVATVQIATMGDGGGGGAAASAGESDLPGGLGGRMFGLVTILAAAGVSSCAGVYFEKILKGAKASLWTRNLQLAGYSVVVGMLKLLLSPEGATLVRAANMAAAPADAGQFRGGAFFHGYTRMTCACIAMNAFGGLLVGTVIKCARAAPARHARSPRRFRAGAPVCLLRLCVPPPPGTRTRCSRTSRSARRSPSRRSSRSRSSTTSRFSRRSSAPASPPSSTPSCSTAAACAAAACSTSTARSPRPRPPARASPCATGPRAQRAGHVEGFRDPLPRAAARPFRVRRRRTHPGHAPPVLDSELRVLFAAALLELGVLLLAVLVYASTARTRRRVLGSARRRRLLCRGLSWRAVRLLAVSAKRRARAAGPLQRRRPVGRGPPGLCRGLGGGLRVAPREPPPSLAPRSIAASSCCVPVDRRLVRPRAAVIAQPPVAECTSSPRAGPAVEVLDSRVELDDAARRGGGRARASPSSSRACIGPAG